MPEPQLRQLCIANDAVWKMLEMWADSLKCTLVKMPDNVDEPGVENYFLSPKEPQRRAERTVAFHRERVQGNDG